MRLKSLEIKGFKSFADKTVLHFDTGITGIIGPNGCGKSNIIDSIRWVIGEQRIANLRSDNLEALIFNGSRSRSASSLAEVSLTFENDRQVLPTDFSTITVSRRFFRNGESEYRLNDVACRLKDIHNLFMDTGVSTDSYSIIELGMVDEIIKDKDNSRRRMLEQAAGITIYKTRKKEAKSKLDGTEQDLARIEDLLFEINNQMKSLESQSKKAEKYYSIRKDYRICAIELAKASLEGINTRYKNFTDEQNAAMDKKIQMEASIAQMEATIQQEKLVNVEEEKALEASRQAFNNLLQEVRNLENEKKLSTQKLHYLHEQQTTHKTFVLKATEELQKIETSIGITENQRLEEQQRLTTMDLGFKDLQESVEEKRRIYEGQRSQLDGLREKVRAMEREKFDAEKKVAVSDTLILNLQREQSQLETENQNRDYLLEKLKAELKDKESELTYRKEDLRKLEEKQEQLRVEILEAQQQLESMRSHLNEENRKLDARSNEYDLLRNLIDSMDGYPESVKFLHGNQGWDKNAQILSDVIYVKEAYRAALENLLSPYLNYYVVDNLQSGMQAIGLLHSQKKGKANFFLMDELENTLGELDEVPGPEGTTRALDVIEVDEKYRKLAERLLRNVYIAEEGIDLPENSPIVILERTGKFVKGRYRLSGGSIGAFEGKKIGRVKNLEKLSDEIVLQQAVVASQKNEINQKNRELEKLMTDLKEADLKDLQQSINTLTNEVFATRNKMENLQAMQQGASDKLQDVVNRLEDARDEIASTRQVLEGLNVHFSELQENLHHNEESYKRAEDEYKAASASFNESNLSLARQQSRLKELDQELNFKQNRLNALREQIKTNETQIESCLQEINQCDTLLQGNAEKLVEFMRRKEDEEVRLNEADQQFYNKRHVLEEKSDKLRELEKEKSQFEEHLDQLKDQLSELKIGLSTMRERLKVEFKINLDDILEKPRETDTPLEELQEKSEKLKRRLENMGEINATAIEAFQEMKKRYEFILEQKNDLIEAKESLLKTIQEVEVTANQQFLDTFNKVKENFQKVFKALFTEEDTADMLLENPSDLSETGIEIVAKPKGKRPSSITQLSGGEKTLTATALLFAVYLIKPAPFCILDEVDAPLDDTNISKFTKMIKRFSEHSQFIIITHNKETMAAVDVVYGVTMQEPGVSKLVPVDFRSLSEN